MSNEEYRSRSALRLNFTSFMVLAALFLFTRGSFATPQGALSVTGNQGLTLVYVPGTAGGITEINSANNVAFATAPWAHGSNGGIAITPDGSRMYVSNHEASSVSVFDTATNVPLLEIQVGLNPIGLAITPDGSHAYVANQNSDNVSVIAIATNSVIKTIQLGAGANPIWVTISPDGSRAYVSNQYANTLSVIDTASNTVLTNIPIGSLPFHSTFARDGRFLWVSVQGEGVVKLVDTNTNTVVSAIPAGPNPRGIAFTPDGSRAYVADFFSNTVAIIDVFGRALTGFVTVGNSPWNLGITAKGIAYVANFADNTISVFDTATNVVGATLPARQGPADVLVNTTARPHILNYSFLAFDPPGSVDTVAHAVNNHGQSVGRFTDEVGVIHGFLRQMDGSFVTIDPPGSGFTVAFSINDAGVIVGIWQLQGGGAFHGFTRSPSGSYTTSDFPGSVDSEFTAINSQGILVGDYDLGDLNTSIAFVNARGAFTSFDNPAAAPAETAALGINSGNFISGFFDDPSGNEHSFVRAPNAQFHNFDFPLADFTDAYKLNDSGDLVGQYATNFPNHGFVLFGAAALTGPPSPCQFLSFDYPDSRNSGARGINNLGQITGFYRLRGAPGRHGFLATPTPGGNSAQNNACQETANFSARHGASFESFDFPGSRNTQATAITPSGEIVGRYSASDGSQHGFVLRDGAFTTVDIPGATSTDAAWVNASGAIVGTYGTSVGGHAYVLSGGAVTTIDFPSATPVCTAGFGISNAGDVVGVGFVCNDFFHGHGYLFSRGQFTLIDVPGAVGTFPTMVIDSTRIVGTYIGSDGVFHGFLRQAGNFTTIDVPNSTFTWITGINPEGEIVGFYFSKNGNQHGFVLNDGEFISVDVPVAGATTRVANGIDAEGDVVGFYTGPDGNTHGYFLRCATCSRRDPMGLAGSTH